MTTSQPPSESPVYFLDRSIASKSLVAVLRKMGFEVEVHNDHFVHDEDDHIWIPPVSKRRWVIVSADRKLARNPINVRCIFDSKAQVVLVTDSNSRPEQWCAALIMGRTRLSHLLGKNPGPVFIAVGREASDHVKVTKQHVLEKLESAKQAE